MSKGPERDVCTWYRQLPLVQSMPKNASLLLQLFENKHKLLPEVL